jgi:TonB family protein
VLPVVAAPGPAVEAAIGSVRVTGSTVNVRAAAEANAEVLTQVKRGVTLELLERGREWDRVRLSDGRIGFVSASLVREGGTATSSTSSRKRAGCPADAEFRFLQTPTPAFAEGGAHGEVSVEVTVSASGVITSTKIIRNTTGDPSLGKLAEREIRSAKFVAPIRNCVSKPFIYTYQRTF